MDLLKYLEPMKNLPERFSNLAFWHGVRNLKDCVVNAFEYLDSWGTHIESLLPNGTYVRSSKISLTPNVEFYPEDLGFRIFTLSSEPNNVITILPILSVIGSPFRINLTTEKTSILIGKHIDAIRVEYLTSDRVRVNFEMPTAIFSPVWFGSNVNGCSIDQCSVLSRYMVISKSELSRYENMTLNSVTIYYH
jgi:hypothetical protein